jgi:nucleotide-binding universal stress UspA family protein
MVAYSRIVVGTDGSDTSFRAVDRAGALAAENAAELLIVRAYKPEPTEVVDQAEDALGDDAYLVRGSGPAEQILREAGDHAQAHGAEKISTRAVQGNPVTVLDKVVDDTLSDLLVVGNVGLNTLASLYRAKIRHRDGDPQVFSPTPYGNDLHS